MFPNMQQVQDNHALEQMLLDYIRDVRNDYQKRREDFDTEKYIIRQLRTLLARNLYDTHASAKIWMEADDTYLEAVRVIQNPKIFRKMGIHD